MTLPDVKREQGLATSDTGAGDVLAVGVVVCANVRVGTKTTTATARPNKTLHLTWHIFPGFMGTPLRFMGIEESGQRKDRKCKTIVCYL